jgi:hypothetical protein
MRKKCHAHEELQRLAMDAFAIFLLAEPWIDDFHAKQMDFPSCFSIVNGGALGGKKSKGL